MGPFQQKKQGRDSRSNQLSVRRHFGEPLTSTASIAEGLYRAPLFPRPEAIRYVFFAAPGCIVTCAHVVGSEASKGSKMCFKLIGDTVTAEVVELDPDPCPQVNVNPLNPGVARN